GADAAGAEADRPTGSEPENFDATGEARSAGGKATVARIRNPGTDRRPHGIPLLGSGVANPRCRAAGGWWLARSIAEYSQAFTGEKHAERAPRASSRADTQRRKHHGRRLHGYRHTRAPHGRA